MLTAGIPWEQKQGERGDRRGCANRKRKKELRREESSNEI